MPDLDRLSERVARSVASELDLDMRREAMVQYGFAVLFTFIIGTSMLLATSAAFRVTYYALAAAITSGLIRAFSGGAHMSSPWRCGIVATVVFTGIGIAGKQAGAFIASGSESLRILIWILVALAWTISILSVWTNSPVDSPDKPISSEKARATYRRLSLLATAVWGAILIIGAFGARFRILGYMVGMSWQTRIATTGGLLWQAFTLTGLGHDALGVVDRAMIELWKTMRYGRNKSNVLSKV